jgi:hypothetical protein
MNNKPVSNENNGTLLVRLNPTRAEGFQILRQGWRVLID